ncbi:AAA family ATPase [Leucobacter sp. HNU]|uniref:AAA family ATPase n=1 Tax=Leucobacter sp. HNU TaxID=3236805 RepID=UPI003A80A882
MVPITTTTRRGIFFVNTYDDTDRRPLSQVYREHPRAYRTGGSELQNFNYFIERARIEGLAADAADRLRRRLLAHPYAFSEMTSLEECLPLDGERRWLLQGLWPYGTFPALVGQAKVGKSTMVAQLVAELATENGRFLGFRSTLTREERARRIVVVNAEVNPQDYAQAIVQHLPDEAELEDAEEYPMDNIRLINLAAASEFDLTDPEKYDRWKLSLTEVTEGGERAPAVLIVDGLTPILEGAGTPADKPGPLVQAIKNLCREVGIDNALMVAHTIQNGGHQLGGIAAAAGPDGTWRYVARDPDAHNPTRKFSVKPRMGGMLIPPRRWSWTRMAV